MPTRVQRSNDVLEIGYLPPVDELLSGVNTVLINGSTYAENDVSTLNVIFSMSHNTLTALFVVNRGVHYLREGKGSSVTGSLES